MIEIIPGINEEDYDEIAKKVALIKPFSEYVQIDFSNNTLVPNQTFMEIERFEKIMSECKGLSFEAHLMVENPDKYIKPLADVGFKRLIAHVEAEDPRFFLDESKYESVEAGIAIDGSSEFDLVEPFLDEVDFVLVMTIEAGPSGQPFMPETIEKIKLIKEIAPDLPIEVDGGINEQTVKLVKEAGATRIVSTSFIYKDLVRIEKAIEKLKNA